MNRRNLVSILTLFTCLIAFSLGCVGPTQPVTTLGQKLGIPQAFLLLRDNFTNRKGNKPQCERKPPLLRIADPANLASPNDAIKAAAQVKAEEDLAPQKIKALKFLAGIGCGCYDEDGKVKNAILAGLADCTPAVRMAAIQLIEATLAYCDDKNTDTKAKRCPHCGGRGCPLCQSDRRAQKKKDKELAALQKKKKTPLCQRCHGAGCSSCCGSCCSCNSAGCCGKDVQKKLNDMAYGMDETTGCYKEPVPAIRAAAQRVLEMCPCVMEPAAATTEEQKPKGDVPEGGQKKQEGDKTEGGDNQNGDQSNPQTTSTYPGEYGPDDVDTVRIITPNESTMHNTTYRPANSQNGDPTSGIDIPVSSRRTKSDFINQTMTTSNDMVVAAVENIDASTSQVAIIFSNELMIPVGQMLLIQTTTGEAQCRVVNSMPGRLYATVLSHNYTSTPQSGEMVRFGVLSQ